MAAWNGRNLRELPAEVEEVHRSIHRLRVGPLSSNVTMFALDSNGETITAFSAFPGKGPGSLGNSQQRMAEYVRSHIADASSRLRLSTKSTVDRETRLTFPKLEVSDATRNLAGVRFFLTSVDSVMNAYLAPVVETTALDDKQRAALAFPSKSTRVDATVLGDWLTQFYPPAMMTRSGYVKELAGTLTLQPAGLRDGQHQAVLQGDVQLLMDDVTNTRYTGRLAVVLTYAAGSGEPISLKGVMRGVFPKQDVQARRIRRISLSAAIHSLPK